MLRLTHTRLLVANYRANFLFYRDVLGLKPTFGNENDVYADFETGGVTLALFRQDLMAQTVPMVEKPAPAERHDQAAFIFEVDNVDATVAALQTRGVHFLTEPQHRAACGIRTA